MAPARSPLLVPLPGRLAAPMGGSMGLAMVKRPPDGAPANALTNDGTAVQNDGTYVENN